MTYFPRTVLQDTTGAAFESLGGGLRVTSQAYLQSLAEGDIANHTPWSLVGVNPALVASAEADLWSAGGVYTYPTGSMGMEVIGFDNTNDVSTTLYSGTSDGGTPTSLIDSGKNFKAATAVAVGDCIVLEKSGTTPEWGYVTAIPSNTELTVAGGFSSGGSGTGRVYAVLDKSASTGAHAIRIEYLTIGLATKYEIVLMNGTGVVPTIAQDIYRVQSLRVIAAGSTGKAVGYISLRHIDNSPIYGYIQGGYGSNRGAIYTVPAGKALYVTSFTCGYAYAHNSTNYCRINTRANVINSWLTDGIFFSFTEVLCSNSSQQVILEIPTKLAAGTDIKVSATSTYAGIGTIALRGWIENAS